jgi:hypothetical protein
MFDLCQHDVNESIPSILVHHQVFMQDSHLTKKCCASLEDMTPLVVLSTWLHLWWPAALAVCQATYLWHMLSCSSAQTQHLLDPCSSRLL